MARTPTETLIAAMEEAEGCEECIVVMTKSDGSLIWNCSTDKRSTKIGLLESAKMWILADMLKEAE